MSNSLLTPLEVTLSNITENRNDTITDDAADDSDPENPTARDIYVFIEQCLLSIYPLTTMALGMLDYHKHFHPHYTRDPS
jgi:hypothetical protein